MKNCAHFLLINKPTQVLCADSFNHHPEWLSWASLWEILSVASYNMHTYVLKSTSAQNKHRQLQCNRIAGESTVTDTHTQSLATERGGILTAYLSGMLTLSPDEMAEVCLVEFMTYKQKRWTVKCTWQFSSTHISISSGPLLWSAFEPSPLGSTQFPPQNHWKFKKKSSCALRDFNLFLSRQCLHIESYPYFSDKGCQICE